MTRPGISVIIPAHNAAATLRQCLESILNGQCKPEEIVVVDDRSTDQTAFLAQTHGAGVIPSPRPGPAAARNAGGRHASHDLLFFVDADVCLHPDAIARVKESFLQPAGFDALIGSYDDSPAAPGLVSQYRNLLHHYVHQNGSPEASTFWAGCGAVRGSTFLAAGGFDETYSEPAIEDIEFGYRLRKMGKRIRLDPALQGKHLKRWTFWGMIRTDVFQRAIPWIELILRDRNLPNDLNVRNSQRVCVVLVFLILAVPLLPVPAVSALPLLAVVIWLNRRFYAFLARRKGPLFLTGAIPLHLLCFFYSGLSIPAALLRRISDRRFRN
ncbi:MAG: glycosyltransferase [Acidobacteriia bacterium]|nr:glycosyltransferase [Terriglobia bacterium]